MSYRVRYTFPQGRTGHWMRDYATREEAQKAIDDRRGDAGLSYTVEEVEDGPDPVSTAAHHVEILRERVKELEAMVEERGKAVTDAHAANHAMHRDLLFALEIGQAMREAMRTGEWRAGHDRSMTNSAVAGWDRWKSSLAKAPSVPVGASEAPREGGDSDRRRLEALDRWLKGETFRLVQVSIRGTLLATDGTYEKDVAQAPTLAALADKLAEKDDRP